jgi:hypothetical protein
MFIAFLEAVVVAQAYYYVKTLIISIQNQP